MQKINKLNTKTRTMTREVQRIKQRKKENNENDAYFWIALVKVDVCLFLFFFLFLLFFLFSFMLFRMIDLHHRRFDCHCHFRCCSSRFDFLDELLERNVHGHDHEIRLDHGSHPLEGPLVDP